MWTGLEFVLNHEMDSMGGVSHLKGLRSGVKAIGMQSIVVAAVNI